MKSKLPLIVVVLLMTLLWMFKERMQSERSARRAIVVDQPTEAAVEDPAVKPVDEPVKNSQAVTNPPVKNHYEGDVVSDEPAAGEKYGVAPSASDLSRLSVTGAVLKEGRADVRLDLSKVPVKLGSDDPSVHNAPEAK